MELVISNRRYHMRFSTEQFVQKQFQENENTN